MKILAITDYFVPAFKAGGPVRSLANMANRLPADYSFHVLTTDRDLGDAIPFNGVVSDRWTPVGRALVYYSGPRSRGMRAIAQIVREVGPHVVYVNSVFSALSIKYLLARRLGQIKKSGLVVAPRGELSPGALRLKAWKKAPFVAGARAAGLFGGAIMQACADMEAAEIRAVLGRSATIVVARNMSGQSAIAADEIERRMKPSGHAAFLYVSRITRKKNLLFALERMRGLRGEVSLTVAGPIDDQHYWHECERVIASLPDNVQVRYVGPVPHTAVQQLMQEHSFFVLPTLSENYGHVVQEALAAACPPVISDRTPWQDLGLRGAGWVLPLTAERWDAAMQACVDMASVEYRQLAHAAAQYAIRAGSVGGEVEETMKMFEAAASRATA